MTIQLICVNQGEAERGYRAIIKDGVSRASFSANTIVISNEEEDRVRRILKTEGVIINA